MLPKSTIFSRCLQSLHRALSRQSPGTVTVSWDGLSCIFSCPCPLSPDTAGRWPPGHLLDTRPQISWRLGVLYLEQNMTGLEGTSGATWPISQMRRQAKKGQRTSLPKGTELPREWCPLPQAPSTCRYGRSSINTKQMNE